MDVTRRFLFGALGLPLVGDLPPAPASMAWDLASGPDHTAVAVLDWRDGVMQVHDVIESDRADLIDAMLAAYRRLNDDHIGCCFPRYRA